MKMNSQRTFTLCAIYLCCIGVALGSNLDEEEWSLLRLITSSDAIVVAKALDPGGAQIVDGDRRTVYKVLVQDSIMGNLGEGSSIVVKASGPPQGNGPRLTMFGEFLLFLEKDEKAEELRIVDEWMGCIGLTTYPEVVMRIEELGFDTTRHRKLGDFRNNTWSSKVNDLLRRKYSISDFRGIVADVVTAVRFATSERGTDFVPTDSLLLRSFFEELAKTQKEDLNSLE